MFTACHPVLSTEARVALTLRLLGGLTTEEIARAFLVPEPTVAQRIVRAKRTLAEARVPFEVPRGAELRRPPVVGARGHLPHLQRGLLGDRRRRLDAAGALRGRAPPRPHPGRARSAGAGGPRPRRADGDPGVALAGARRPVGRADPAARPEPRALGSAPHPPRSRGARARRGARRRASARTRCRPRSPPVTRARAPPEETDWARIAALYDALAQLAPSPVVELNRAVAVAMAFGPAAGLELVDALTVGAVARGLPPPAERARRPARQARPLRRGARGVRARGVAHRNARERELLLERAAACARARLTRPLRGGGRSAPCGGIPHDPLPCGAAARGRVRSLTCDH